MTTRVARHDVQQLASTYLAFLWDAFDKKSHRFRNFMSHKREWLEDFGSEDSHARALWAAGMALGRSKNDGHRNLCALLFQQGLPAVEHFTSPRAWAFVLLAMQEYLRTYSGDRVVNQMRDLLTTRLLDHYNSNSTADWQWFEVMATYDNAKLSHAMILSGYWTSRGDVLEAGLQSLRWLVETQKAPAGHFAPDRVQWFLDARERAGPLRPAAARSPLHDLRIARSLRAHPRRILEARRAALLRVVPRAQRSRAVAFTIPAPAAAATRCTRTG